MTIEKVRNVQVRLRWLLLVLLAGLALGQTPRYDGIALGPKGPIPFASVAFCTQPANTSTQPCSPLANLCSSLTDTTCSSPNPVTSDLLGNYHAYIQGGQGPVTVQIYGPTVASPFVEGDQLSGQLSTLNGMAYVDGTHFPTVQSAIAAMTALGGGIVHAEGCKLASCLALGTLDVGNYSNPGPAVTVYLGPYNYTATQIVLRRAFHLLGVSNGDASGTGTVITATSTSTPLLVGPQLGTDQPTQHALVENIRFKGATSNTADGLFFDTAGIGSGGAGGVWYTQIRNCVFDSFGGNGIHIRSGGATGGTSQGAVQFISFYDTTVYRTQAGGNAVRIEGAAYQIYFWGGQYDAYLGNGGIDTSANPNVYIGCASCTIAAAMPYIIAFYTPTIEGASTLVQIDGANNVLFTHPHHEQAYIGYLFSIPSSTFLDANIAVTNASFNGTVGINSGSGYLAKVTASQAMGILIRDSWYPGNGSTPDHYFASTGGAPITCCDFTGNAISNTSGDWPAKPLPNVNNVGRIGFFNGTQLTTSAFAFSGSWGTSPSFTSVRGTDSSFQLVFSSGSGSPGANPQIQFTFADGTWTTVPICFLQGISGTTGNWVEDTSSSATLLKMDFIGTPGASTSFTVNAICGESPN